MKKEISNESESQNIENNHKHGSNSDILVFVAMCE